MTRTRKRRKPSRVKFKVRAFWSDVNTALVIGLVVGFLVGAYLFYGPSA